VVGVVGRDSAEVRLDVARNNSASELLPRVLAATQDGTAVNSDDWPAYARLNNLGRSQAGVCHSRREWARDDDGDGIREVHNNTIEGTWTGLRIFLSRFRGVSKHYLNQYAAIYAWCCNAKTSLESLLRALLGKGVSGCSP
jgi:transposase